VLTSNPPTSAVPSPLSHRVTRRSDTRSRAPWLGSGHPVLRRRPLQEHQRHAGARRGRLGADNPRGAHQREHPTRRLRRADGR
jgi:hypothetical protein